jgi:hypothetical protein
MSSHYLAPHNQVMPKARTAALRALHLDDSLTEAHTSLALIAENYDWDWQTAETEYRRAMQVGLGSAGPGSNQFRAARTVRRSDVVSSPRDASECTASRSDRIAPSIRTSFGMRMFTDAPKGRG